MTQREEAGAPSVDAPASSSSPRKSSALPTYPAATPTATVAGAEAAPVAGRVLEVVARGLVEDLERIDPNAIAALAEMFSEPAMGPETCISIVANVRRLTKAQQREIAALYASGDPEKRMLARTRAANVPPSPPARLEWLRSALRDVERTLGDCISIGTDELEAAAGSLRAVLRASSAAYRDTKRREGF